MGFKYIVNSKKIYKDVPLYANYLNDFHVYFGGVSRYNDYMTHQIKITKKINENKALLSI